MGVPVLWDAELGNRVGVGNTWGYLGLPLVVEDVFWDLGDIFTWDQT